MKTETIEIVDRGRGPQLSTTRITVMDVFYWYHRGYSWKEIADIMECPAGTVMSRLYRSRKILQKLLYDYAVEQGIVDPARTPREGGESEAPNTVDLQAYRRKRDSEGVA